MSVKRYFVVLVLGVFAFCLVVVLALEAGTLVDRLTSGLNELWLAIGVMVLVCAAVVASLMVVRRRRAPTPDESEIDIERSKSLRYYDRNRRVGF